MSDSFNEPLISCKDREGQEIVVGDLVIRCAEPLPGYKHCEAYYAGPKDELPLQPGDEAIHDAIDAWHNDKETDLTLHAYLGMTEVEYANWVENRRPSELHEVEGIRGKEGAAYIKVAEHFGYWSSINFLKVKPIGARGPYSVQGPPGLTGVEDPVKLSRKFFYKKKSNEFLSSRKNKILKPQR